MAIIIESALYIDPQNKKPAGFCACCGGEIYSPGGQCFWCENNDFPPLVRLSDGYREAAKPLNAVFALPQFSTDNAMGAAVLAARAMEA